MPCSSRSPPEVFDHAGLVLQSGRMIPSLNLERLATRPVAGSTPRPEALLLIHSAPNPLGISVPAVDLDRGGDLWKGAPEQQPQAEQAPLAPFLLVSTSPIGVVEASSTPEPAVPGQPRPAFQLMSPGVYAAPARLGWTVRPVAAHQLRPPAATAHRSPAWGHWRAMRSVEGTVTPEPSAAAAAVG